jgi:hypothetical protein
MNSKLLIILGIIVLVLAGFVLLKQGGHASRVNLIPDPDSEYLVTVTFLNGSLKISKVVENRFPPQNVFKKDGLHYLTINLGSNELARNYFVLATSENRTDNMEVVGHGDVVEMLVELPLIRGVDSILLYSPEGNLLDTYSIIRELNK